MNKKPKLIFKYRSLNNDKDFKRIEGIINNNKLYFPNIYQLNDPFEGYLCPPITGIAGSSLSEIADQDHPIMNDIKKNVHILALSEDCFSPQLWAYYCNNYSGIALCFTTDISFKNIKPVEYKESGFELYQKYGENAANTDFHKALLECVMYKQEGWKYEKEWRIVRSGIKKPYYTFNKNELIAVIIGHNVDDKYIDNLKHILPYNFPIFKTYAGAPSGKIHFLPYDYKVELYGKRPDFIDTNTELIKAIKNY